MTHESCCGFGSRCMSSGDRKLRTKCYACGLSVCTAPGCSIRTTYYKYGVVRLCVTCMLLYPESFDRPLRRLFAAEYRTDGHDETAIPALVNDMMSQLLDRKVHASR